MSVIIRFQNAIFTSHYLKTQRIEKEGKKEHLPNRTQKGTSIKQLHVVTNQYYIITLIKNLNPENKSMIYKQIFHICSRFHGLLYFTHEVYFLYTQVTPYFFL